MDVSSNNTQAIADQEDEGTEVHIRDANDEKQFFGPKNDQPVTITVVGTYSSRYRRLVAANRDRAIKRRSLDGDDLEQRSLDLVAGCIIAWDGFTAGSQPYPLTKANAVALLDACPWIREQVEAAMNNHALFFKAS